MTVKSQSVGSMTVRSQEGGHHDCQESGGRASGLSGVRGRASGLPGVRREGFRTITLIRIFEFSILKQPPRETGCARDFQPSALPCALLHYTALH